MSLKFQFQLVVFQLLLWLALSYLHRVFFFGFFKKFLLLYGIHWFVLFFPNLIKQCIFEDWGVLELTHF